ncbi:MAG: endonuclease/exonuclease/phosphatase family protein [Opitutaceae bacterium]|nr:endonuclease/exonuclease/phosphatase family protein [Opitutaceae bacterium]
MLWTLSVLTFVLAVFTALPWSKRTEWWIRGADFPRTQFLVLGAALLAASILFLDTESPHTWFILVVVSLCILQQAYWILPYTPFARSEVKDAQKGARTPRLRLISANVLCPNPRRKEFLALVEREDPDLLVTLETDSSWEDLLRPIEKRLPHTLRCPLDNLYGMHLYSRWPFRDARIQFLVEKDVPSMHLLLQHPEGPEIRVHILHPAPPSPTENETSSERDAELVMVGKSTRGSRFPIIVTGDLNDVAWSRTTRLFRKLSGLLDPRIGRGFYNTFHAHWWPMRWPVDHVFHSDHFTLVELRRLPAGGSDHFPMLVELALEPGAAERQEGLSPDAEDKEQAEETLAQEQVSPGAVHRPGG